MKKQKQGAAKTKARQQQKCNLSKNLFKPSVPEGFFYALTPMSYARSLRFAQELLKEREQSLIEIRDSKKGAVS